MWVNSGTLLAAALGMTSVRSSAQNAILQSWGESDGKPVEYAESYGISPKGYQSWMSIGETDAEAEAPILWAHDAKNWLIGKDPDAGKHWRQEEKGMTEDEMVGWPHWFDGHEFEQALGDGEGQGSLESCSPWGCKELDTTERLNWTDGISHLWVASVLRKQGTGCGRKLFASFFFFLQCAQNLQYIR